MNIDIQKLAENFIEEIYDEEGRYFRNYTGKSWVKEFADYLESKLTEEGKEEYSLDTIMNRDSWQKPLDAMTTKPSQPIEKIGLLSEMSDFFPNSKIEELRQKINECVKAFNQLARILGSK